MLSAPLLLSCDIAGMDDATFRLLTNDELIAVDQDPLVSPPEIRDRGNGVLGYSKRLADGSTAIALFNRSDDRRTCRLEKECKGRELWNGEERELCGEMTIQPHSVQLYRTLPAPFRQEFEFRNMVKDQLLQGVRNLSAGSF